MLGRSALFGGLDGSDSGSAVRGPEVSTSGSATAPPFEVVFFREVFLSRDFELSACASCKCMSSSNGEMTLGCSM